MGSDKGKRILIEDDDDDDDAEDWCFVCKDGGKLLICDHKGCGKAYHPRCVGKKNSVLKSEGVWSCPRHYCSECPRKKVLPEFYCLCCPAAFCRLCARSSHFVPVKSNKGMCRDCFDLTQLVETNAEVNSKGDKIDFTNKDSEEFMFKDYLEIIMEKEELTFDQLRKAEFMKENYFSSSEADKSEEKDAEVINLADVSNADFAVTDHSFGKIKEPVELVQENEICDPLEAPSADTLGQSNSGENENDMRSSSEIEDEQLIGECKRQRTLGPDKVSPKKKIYAIRKDYASIVADNIKLVYLRRSLVEKLLVQPEKSEEKDKDEGSFKVKGSFVRVKTGNPSAKTFQLRQVKDIKIDQGIVLQVFLNDDNTSDIPIDMLSDDDFSEEECADLRQRMKDGFHRQPTVMELEQKALSLHEDITKNWIDKELASLQNRIDFAHEKGRRNMLEQCLKKRETLKKPSHKEQLLQKRPSVIREEIPSSSIDSSESDCSTGTD